MVKGTGDERLRFERDGGKARRGILDFLRF
jgi:hypothetical protein